MGPDWGYSYGGDDWGNDCKVVEFQSPINLPLNNPEKFKDIPADLKAMLDFGQSDDIVLSNNGHVLEFIFEEDTFTDILIPIVDGELLGIMDYSPSSNVTYVPGKLANYHLHSPSENTFDGLLAMAEGHFVIAISQEDLPTCPQEVCNAVVAVPYRYDIDNSENDFLADVLEMTGGMLPSEKGMTITLNSTLDLHNALPKDDFGYVMFTGSLTTPPCSGGLLWHVLKSAEPISREQVALLQEAISLTNDGISHNNRNVQPLNDRVLLNLEV